MQIAEDKIDPNTAANPIGNNVCAYNLDARYAPGIRTKMMDRTLCKKEIPDFPHAQKYPLKQK